MPATKTKYQIQKEKIITDVDKYIKWGREKGYIAREGDRIKYTAVGRSYDFSDPKEKVRLKTYFELIEKYKYPADRIEFEISASGQNKVYADIVVFSMGEERKPYIVIECKGERAKKEEIRKIIKQTADKARFLKASFAACVFKDGKIVIDMRKWDGINLKNAIINDIPVCYEK